MRVSVWVSLLLVQFWQYLTNSQMILEETSGHVALYCDRINNISCSTNYEELYLLF